MANWSQKKMLLTIGGATLGVCVAAGGGVYYTNGLIEEVNQQVAQKQGEIAAAKQKLAKVPSLEKEVVILRENLGEYVKILPDEQELTEFLRMLNTFEKQSGIKGMGLTEKPMRGRVAGRFVPIQYTYQIDATLWQGLKFMNLIENYERFVSITDFSIKPGKRKGNEAIVEGEAVHDITLSIQTYQYNPPAAGKEVEIPKYADRREELSEEIWKRMQEQLIQIEHHEHKGQQGRRDIFVDPRERGGLRDDPNRPSTTDQRQLVDKYAALVVELKTMRQRMAAKETTLLEEFGLQKRFGEDLARLVAGVSKDAGVIAYRPLKLRWAQEVVDPMGELIEWHTGGGNQIRDDIDKNLTGEQIRQLIALMTADCENGQLEQARQRYEAASDRLVIDEEDPRHRLAVDAKRQHIKAVTALDFKQLDLDVQGVVVNGAGRSGVLLNGDVYEEGDYVSEDLLVKLVEEEQIWFVFRGLTLVRTM